MSYKAICTALNMPDIEITIRCMRLQFLQAMVNEPLKHQLFWCSMLAKYEFEEQAVSNPWAEQFCKDIASLEGLDGVQQLVTQVGHYAQNKGGRALKILIQNLECRSEFLNLDIKQYKQREIKRQQAHRFAYDYEGEQGAKADHEEQESREDEFHDPPHPPEVMYECRMLKTDGSVC